MAQPTVSGGSCPEIPGGTTYFCPRLYSGGDTHRHVRGQRVHQLLLGQVADLHVHAVLDKVVVLERRQLLPQLLGGGVPVHSGALQVVLPVNTGGGGGQDGTSAL